MKRGILAVLVCATGIGAAACGDRPTPAAPSSLTVRTVATLPTQRNKPATPSCRPDTTAPNFTQVSATPNVLWPPDHRMVQMTVDAAATDDCDQSPSSRVTKVTSNEAI